ncbi:hypothetical protein ACFFRR_003083 [Megaselia abdita]
MEKTPRYTQRERNMVLGFAAQYRDVIENKKTDAESNRRKDEIWRIISKEFNARVYHQRTSKQLRQLYKNMKLLLKKDLCSDGGLTSMPMLAGKKPKSFMDILTAFSQASSVSQLLASPPSNNGTNSDGGSSGGHYNGMKVKGGDYDDIKYPLIPTSYNSNGGNHDDIVVIKSEEMSDNDSQNGIDMDEDDDCLSTKDIPEVCIEEEDEDLFPRSREREVLMQSMSNGKMDHHNRNGEGGGVSVLNLAGNGGVPGIMSGLHHHINDNSAHSNDSHSPPSPNKDILMALTIEERKRKIELLNAQIEYWKTLTKKLETSGNNNNGAATNVGDSVANPPTPSCHCHLSGTPRINGINQS